MNNTSIAEKSVNISDNFRFGKNPAKVYTGKKNSKKSFFKKVGIFNIIAFLFILFILANIVNTISVEIKLDKKTTLLEKEYNSVKSEQNYLNRQIAYFKSSAGIEKLARERLGYIRNDEIPVRYINNR